MRPTADDATHALAPHWPLVASGAIYCLLTAVAGRHVLAHPASTIVHDPGDPLLTAALLYWNASVLPLTHAWWQFPIFHPTPDTLAFSEHLLGLSPVATPVEWLVRDPLAAANIVTLLTYPLCGVAMFLLVRRLTGSSAAAFLSGLAFAFSPYRVAQLPHVQMLAAFWAPLGLWALHGYLDSRQRRWLVLYGAAWLLQAMANGYSLFFFSLLVALWTAWFVIVPRRWAELRGIAMATVCAAVPLAPTLGTYIAVHARHGFARTIVDAQGFSADIASLLCAPDELAVWGWLRVGCRPEASIFPGLVLFGLVVTASVWLVGAGRREPSSAVLRTVRIVVLAAGSVAAAVALSAALAGPWHVSVGALHLSVSSFDKPFLIALSVGLVALVLSPGALLAVRRQSTVGFYLAAALAMWVMALGPAVMLRGIERPIPGPFRLLFFLPGGGGLRAPGRFWLMATLCLAVVVGLTVSELLRRRPRMAGLVTVLLAVGLLSDGWATINAAPAPERYPDEGALRGGAVLALPAGNFQDFAPQYLAVVGGWRSINGYSGYEPRYYEGVRQGSRFESDGLFEPFRSRADLFVVVGRGQVRLRDLVERQPGVQLMGDRDDLRQYRLPRRDVRASEIAGAHRLTIAAATSPCAPNTARLAVDGRLDTRWVCGPQAGHETFVIDLGGPTDDVGSVRYALGEYFGDFPRVLAIETSLDGDAWTPARTGDVIAETIEGALADPLRAPAVVRFTPRPARYVRLRQEGKDDQVNWSLAEVEVWAEPPGETAKAY